MQIHFLNVCERFFLMTDSSNMSVSLFILDLRQMAKKQYLTIENSNVVWY